MSADVFSTGRDPEPMGSFGAIRRVLGMKYPFQDELQRVREKLSDAAAAFTEKVREQFGVPVVFAFEAADLVAINRMEDCDPAGIRTVILISEDRKCAVVTMDCQLVRKLVALIFGGTSCADQESMVRPATGVEKATAAGLSSLLIEKIIANCCRCRNTVVAGIVDLDGVSNEGSPETYFVMSFKSNLSGMTIRVWIPAALACGSDRDERQESRDTRSAAAPEWSRLWQKAACEVAVDLSVVAEGPMMPLDEVASFSVGCCLEFDSGSVEGLSIEVQGSVLFSCRMGQARDRLIASILNPMDIGDTMGTAP